MGVPRYQHGPTTEAPWTKIMDPTMGSPRAHHGSEPTTESTMMSPRIRHDVRTTQRKHHETNPGACRNRGRATEAPWT